MPQLKGYTIAAFAGLALAVASPVTHVLAQDSVGNGTATAREAEPQPLFVGDKAPELTIGKWIKGEPVTGFEKGRTYVVEFWATWCGPCRKAIPHLTELAHANKDKVEFIGVSVWEHEDTFALNEEKVSKFVKDMGDKMDYHVAMDNTEEQMSANWMRAAGQDGIPATFIINGEGRVAWIGHPGSIEEPLAQIVAGTWDINAESQKQKKEAESAAARKQVMDAVRAAVGNNDWDAAIAAATEYAKTSNDPQADMMIWGLLNQKGDFKAAVEHARATYNTTAKDNANILNQYAWLIMTEDNFKAVRDLDLCFAIAQQAVTASNGENPAILDTLARAYFEKGDVAKAIETQNKAIEKADGDMKAELEATLKTYQDKKPN